MATELSIRIEKKFSPKALPVLSANLTFGLDTPKILAVLGPSGSGKTTLLRCLAGLESPDDGLIRFMGETWFESGQKINWRPQKRGIGYVSQEYALFPHLTVDGNIRFGLRDVPQDEAQKRCLRLIELLKLEGLEHRYPFQLSGGQRQRVALARALAIQPRLLLMDEPLSALDTVTREFLRPLLKDLLDDLKVPTVFVTHDRNDVWALADQILILSQGQVLQLGRVAEVFARPKTISAARILGVENLLKATVTEYDDCIMGVKFGSEMLRCQSATRISQNSVVTVCIRAEEISVLPQRNLQKMPWSSTLNILSGKLLDAKREGVLMRLKLDCGVLLNAVMTPPAFLESQLSVGDPIHCFIAASSVHLISL